MKKYKELTKKEKKIYNAVVAAAMAADDANDAALNAAVDAAYVVNTLITIKKLLLEN